MCVCVPLEGSRRTSGVGQPKEGHEESGGNAGTAAQPHASGSQTDVIAAPPSTYSPPPCGRAASSHVAPPLTSDHLRTGLKNSSFQKMFKLHPSSAGKRQQYRKDVEHRKHPHTAVLRRTWVPCALAQR